MKLRIVSDGTTRGTHVTTPDGEELRGVAEVTWRLTAGRDNAEVVLRIRGAEVDVEGEGQVPRLPAEVEDLANG